MSDGGWGGYRPGAGRKPADYEPPPERVDFERERAEHERVKREQREFKLAVERGEYLPRELQRQAASTALSVLTQALRAIPDNLERSMGLAPDVVEEIGRQIDVALAECAVAFKAMTNDG